MLRRAYPVDAGRCGELIAGLLDARELVVGDREVVRTALATPNDFADAVIAELGRAAGCTHTLTFDHRAARSTSMQLLADDESGVGK